MNKIPQYREKSVYRPKEVIMDKKDDANAKEKKCFCYKCSVCGIVQEGDSAPAVCPKCDNDKFYKIVK